MIRSTRPGQAAAMCAALSLAFVPAAPGLAQTVGVAAAVRNAVEIKPRTAPRARPLALRAPVALADEVRTRADSRAQLILLDQSTFTVGPNARVTIDRFVYDPARNARSMGATVARGAFRFMSGRPVGVGSSNSTIRTPTASAGIRGTIVEGIVGKGAVDIASREAAVGPGVGGDKATASLIVLRGPGPLQQGTGRPGLIEVTAGGKLLTLDRPMLAVYVPGAGKAPIGPFRISPAGLERLHQFLAPPPLPAGAARLSLGSVRIPDIGAAGTAGSAGPAPPPGLAGGVRRRSPAPYLVAVLAAVAGAVAIGGGSKPASP